MIHDQFREDMRRQQRELEIQKIKNRKNRQNQCGHRKSETGVYPTGGPNYACTLAFHLLKLPTGEIVGVCPYCQKMISSIDPSDKEYFKLGNLDTSNMPQSGQFLQEDDNQLFAQLARYTPEEKDRILKETISELKKEQKLPVREQKCVQHDTDNYKDYPSEQEMREMPLENLKVLAADFIKKTYPKRNRKK